MSISLNLRLAIASHYSEDACSQWLEQKEVDWWSLLQEASQTKLAPLLYYSLKKFPRTDVPEDVHTHFRQIYLATALRNMQMHQQLKRVTEALSAIGVRYILLKGAALIQDVYWGNMALRPMSDIDILVNKDDYVLACNAVASFSKRAPNISSDGVLSYHQGFYLDDKVTIEIHARLFSLAFADAFAFEKLYASKRNSAGLSFANQFVHLCAHAGLHHQGSIPRFGADAAFVSLYILDWLEVWKIAHEGNTLPSVQWGLKQIQELWFIEVSTEHQVELNSLQPTLLARFNQFCATSVARKNLAIWFSLPNTMSKFRYIWVKLFPPREYLAAYWPVLEQSSPLWKLYLKRLVLLPTHLMENRGKQELTSIRLGSSNHAST